MNKLVGIICLVISISPLFISSCSKEWLDAKRDIATVVPQTLKDYQGMLDDPYTINRSYANIIGKAAGDDFFVNDADLATLDEDARKIYSWEKDLDFNAPYSTGTSEWTKPFTVIEYANLVLDGLKMIDNKQPGWNDLKGQAHFYRALAYFNAGQVFCKPYDKNTAGTELGLPIRLSADVNQLVQRSTLEQLYVQIIADANEALEHLNATQPFFRPSKVAANALLAKIYFLMNDYPNAEKYAGEVLKTRNLLLDFNDPAQVSDSKVYKFSELGKDNPEVLMYLFSGGYSFSGNYAGNMVQASRTLYDLYSDDDLRKKYYFGIDEVQDRIEFIASYTGRKETFEGLALNDILLVHAECCARANKIDQALEDINKLLKNRYKTGKNPVITETNPDELIRIILLERRKELAHMAHCRWEDLRRLNMEGRFPVTLNRVVNGATIVIPPNDPRYVMPVPQGEIRFSGIAQNPRN